MIFEILDDMKHDISGNFVERYAKEKHLSDMKITYVYHNQTYNLDNGKVDTLLSNDSGVAFIVKKQRKAPFIMLVI